MTSSRLALLLALLLSSPCLLSAADESTDAAPPEPRAEQLSPLLDYQAQLSEPVTHQVDFRVIVTPPAGCQVLRVWLPLPPSHVGQQVSDSKLSTFPEEVQPQIGTEPVYGNTFAYFEFHRPQGAQIIRHTFTVRLWEFHWDVDPARVQVLESWPESFVPYLQPQGMTRQAEFTSLLQELAPRRTSGAADLRRVLEWVDQNVTYDHAQASLRADANHAFDLRRGHCSDYHGLCATMGRALGYPTRVTYGLNLYPKNSPSHCKLEVFLPPYGWVSYDVSETQKLTALVAKDDSLSPREREALSQVARERLHRGFRENSWLLVTRGTDYDLEPKASRPVRVVRTIYAEADGEPLPDPDPANPQQREFGWMTAHGYVSDRPFVKPFEDVAALREAIGSQ